LTVSAEFGLLNLSLLQEGAVGDNVWGAMPLESQITRRQTENIAACLPACLSVCLFIIVHMLLFFSPDMLTILIAVELHS
jgi:hypothetical protein